MGLCFHKQSASPTSSRPSTFAESRYTDESALMKKRSLSVTSGLLAIFSCLCLIVATERRAYAYIDPGSGFLALQSIASVMAAAGFFLRQRIKALFTRSKSPQNSSVKSRTDKPTLVLPVAARKNDSRNAA
jgi:hypothetical protein